MPLLDVAELVNAVHRNAGTTLEEIRLQLREVPVQFVNLFESLAQFPALQKCDIDCRLREPINQFVPAVTSLFQMSHVNITVGQGYFTGVPACQIVHMINQIKIVHPGLLVDFGSAAGGHSLILSLGKASIRKSFFAQNGAHCGAEDCVRCQSFYPTLLNFLSSRAQHAVINSIQAQHFPNWQLDRCRVGRSVDHLDALYTAHWRVLSIEVAEDQQSATIYFEANNQHHHLFSITIGCGRCLSNGCMKC